ncbi:AraC family transcriptional regulator [Blastococcus sp. TF02A-26]|uniref:helix-turn-helix domain-containing protein n=1 Tax=Blastococcus sp. TF02A-26 TaxID=2250577 RepID=UPI000DEA2DF9|nr:AraC family transcriptional regulator [Blastococcus sp. TF02A-26]RBY90796.1 AraC family transcriptional regulator [Blastococcus sp. TF02A-26]
MDVPDTGGERVRAWRPAVPGVSEVLHARFVAHAYPAHTHDEWTLLLVDSGAVRYDLGRDQHGALSGQVTVLPPQVAHTGRAVSDAGFRKRVVYVEPALVPPELTGRAVDTPALPDPLLASRVGQLHRALATPGDELEAESRLALVLGRVAEHLRGRPAAPGEPAGRAVAADLRDLLDATLAEGIALADAARLLGVHPDSLVRAFSRTFGLPPHRYVIGRRVDAARHRLLAGEPPAEVATAVGFCDQAHLNRHFRRLLGTTPSRYARSAA